MEQTSGGRGFLGLGHDPPAEFFAGRVCHQEEDHAAGGVPRAHGGADPVDATARRVRTLPSERRARAPARRAGAQVARLSPPAMAWAGGRGDRRRPPRQPGAARLRPDRPDGRGRARRRHAPEVPPPARNERPVQGPLCRHQRRPDRAACCRAKTRWSPRRLPTRTGRSSATRRCPRPRRATNGISG